MVVKKDGIIQKNIAWVMGTLLAILIGLVGFAFKHYDMTIKHEHDIMSMKEKDIKTDDFIKENQVEHKNISQKLTRVLTILEYYEKEREREHD